MTELSRRLLTLVVATLLAGPAAAQVAPCPPGMTRREVETNGTRLHVRVGGQGPAVVLLHGYGETGDRWDALAIDPLRDHTAVAPDLRDLIAAP